MKKFKKMALAVALSSLYSTSAYVQVKQEINSSSDLSPEERLTDLFAVEEIVVTGTRIRRDSVYTPMSVYSISREDIELVGTNALSDILLENPAVLQGSNQINSASSLQSSGLSTIDLRSLGDNRTLVLIDGRRAVSNSANGNRVSLGTIPSDFVERVEIITGGASAIYGSDAVAGVVNIITEGDREGFNIGLNYGATKNRSTSDATLDISYGQRFADEKGYFFAAINYDDESALEAVDVPRALVQARWRYDDGENLFQTVDGYQPAGEVSVADYADLSSEPDGGRFDGDDFWYDNDGLRTDFETDRNGFDFRRDDRLFTPRERLNLALKLKYEMGNTEFFSSLIFSDIETEGEREPEGDDYNDPHVIFDPLTGTPSFVSSGRIPVDNPFVPQVIKDEVSSRGVRWDRRFVELGNQRTLNNRKTLRSWLGLRGKFLDTWEWESTAGFGRYTQNQTRFNEVNILKLAQGLNAELGPGGAIQCADENARASGCVPVNLFGRGSITPDAADYIRADLSLTAELEQTNVSAIMNGRLFSLYAGDVRVAIGAEYRKDTLALEPDALNRNGGHSSGFVPAFSAESDVGEIFSEVSIPLVADLPGARLVTWDLSFRRADYAQENVGVVTSFGTGIQWRFTNSLSMRTSFNRALRAPDLTELFSPPRGDSDDFRDICDGVTLDSPGRVSENCRKESGVLAYINDPGNDGEFEDERLDKPSPNSGNLDLREESADTFTGGIIWRPSFFQGFDISSDYYSIEIDDVIGSYGNRDTLRGCYDTDEFDENSFFCRQITRDSEGQIASVVQRQVNLNSLETSGVDTSLRYTANMGAGEFSLRYVHSHVIKHLQTEALADSLKTTVNKGYLERGIFEDRSRFELKWKNESFTASWRVRYFGSIVEDQSTENRYREALADNLADPVENPNAERPLYLDVGSEMFHDVSVSRKLELSDASLRVFVGARNAFDNRGPFLPSGTDGGAKNSSNEYGVSALMGRYVYMGFDLKI